MTPDEKIETLKEAIKLLNKLDKFLKQAEAKSDKIKTISNNLQDMVFDIIENEV